MKDFEAVKANLLSELDMAIRQNPEDKIIITLRNIIRKINSPSALDGGLTRIVVDSLDFKLKVGERIVTFENSFLIKPMY
ncbi:hypothetical protein [Adhaeribacter rhizoryzae]|uniref:Uncharacterized protein n=1 Tax=Adhaeribacter rhizoryzae TaxID=2607907 RepID=A0A5M6DGW0_9BACT|nr:hypothetical protein [Adhaeribacter rhizoryzae]KAA5546653.1 hypothetical protein F0145_09910 [Adhaeribacter rhizoryzae]